MPTRTVRDPSSILEDAEQAVLAMLIDQECSPRIEFVDDTMFYARPPADLPAMVGTLSEASSIR
jgi:hypothetical protein